MVSVLARLEGGTALSRNPYPPENLGWATWIIARLSGWKVYFKKRPSGLQTLHEDLIRFYEIYYGWETAQQRYV